MKLKFQTWETLLFLHFFLQHVNDRWFFTLYALEEKIKRNTVNLITFKHVQSLRKVELLCITLLFAGWLCRVCRSLGISKLHPLNVLLADHFMLYDGMWVVFPYDTSCCLLDTAWCFPGLIDVLSWELLQKRKVLPVKNGVDEKYKRYVSVLKHTKQDQWGYSLTWCILHFCLSSCQTRWGSRPWRTGERKHSLKATASFQHSEPSRHPTTAFQTPSEGSEQGVRALFHQPQVHNGQFGKKDQNCHHLRQHIKPALRPTQLPPPQVLNIRTCCFSLCLL